MRRWRAGRGDDRRAAELADPLAARAEIRVRLQPRATREGIVGERDGAVVVRVSAPPVAGKANKALCRLIAKRAGVGLARVTVRHGKRSRDKVVRVDGIDPEALRHKLEL